ncbi:unnamed protein product, partial [Acanthoscelides obtectus]
QSDAGGAYEDGLLGLIGDWKTLNKSALSFDPKGMRNIHINITDAKRIITMHLVLYGNNGAGSHKKN